MKPTDLAPTYPRRRTLHTDMSRRIQIDYELFRDLTVYVLGHAKTGNVLFERIREGILRKQAAMKRHMAYTLYKTGKTHEQRQLGRNIYLEFIGLADDYRWSVEQDYNVIHTNAHEQPP